MKKGFFRWLFGQWRFYLLFSPLILFLLMEIVTDTIYKIIIPVLFIAIFILLVFFIVYKMMERKINNPKNKLIDYY